MITVPSFPCTPGPSWCFIMVLLQERVTMHTVTLHLASGISLWFAKNNLSNSAIKYMGRRKIKLQECALVLTFTHIMNWRSIFFSIAQMNDQLLQVCIISSAVHRWFIRRDLMLSPSCQMFKTWPVFSRCLQDTRSSSTAPAWLFAGFARNAHGEQSAVSSAVVPAFWSMELPTFVSANRGSLKCY